MSKSFIILLLTIFMFSWNNLAAQQLLPCLELYTHLFYPEIPGNFSTIIHLNL